MNPQEPSGLAQRRKGREGRINNFSSLPLRSLDSARNLTFYDCIRNYLSKSLTSLTLKHTKIVYKVNTTVSMENTNL